MPGPSFRDRAGKGTGLKYPTGKTTSSGKAKTTTKPSRAYTPPTRGRGTPTAGVSGVRAHSSGTARRTARAYAKAARRNRRQERKQRARHQLVKAVKKAGKSSTYKGLSYLDKQTVKQARKYDLKPSHLAGQQEQESGRTIGGPTSSAGAFGVSQFIPSTARSYGVKPGTSKAAVKSQVRGQAAYMKDLGATKDPNDFLDATVGYLGADSDDYKAGVAAGAEKHKNLDKVKPKPSPKAVKQLNRATKKATKVLGPRKTKQIVGTKPAGVKTTTTKKSVLKNYEKSKWVEARDADTSLKLQRPLGKALVKLGKKTGEPVVVNEGMRTAKRQQELIDQGYPAAPVGQSKHQIGAAVDADSLTPEQRAKAPKVGLGFPVAGEPWHLEVTGKKADKIVADPTANVQVTKKVMTRFNAMKKSAKRLDRAQKPYELGGGHVAGKIPGPGKTNYDCSSAVSKVLQDAGMLKGGALVSGDFENFGKPGPGAVTIFANSGHVFMKIGKKYFGTSRSNPDGGAGFMPDPGESYRSGFTVRHVPMGALDDKVKFKTGGGGGGFPGMSLSSSGTSATMTSGVTMDTPGESDRPIKPGRQARRSKAKDEFERRRRLALELIGEDNPSAVPPKTSYTPSVRTYADTVSKR